MMNQASLGIEVEKTAEGRRALIRFRPDLKRHGGQRADVKLVLFCKVDHSNPINKKVELLSESFKVSKPLHTLRYKCPRRLFTYEGNWIRLYARVSILIGDDHLSKKFEAPLELGNIHLSEDIDETINPPDEQVLVKNLFMIPAERKSVLLALWGGCLVFLFLTERFIRSSLLTMSREVFELGLIFLLGPACGLLYFAWKKTKAYWKAPDLGLHFNIPEGLSRGSRSKAKINRQSRLLVSDWISGKAAMDLDGVRLRVVAGNIERGPCHELEGSMTSDAKLVKKDVSVVTRAMVLYDKTIERLPAGTEFAEYFRDPLDFEPVFTDLYPPDLVATRGFGGRLSLSSTHGLGYYLEFQLLHPDLADLKYEVESSYFDPTAFFSEPASAPPASPLGESGSSGVEETGADSPPPPPPGG